MAFWPSSVIHILSAPDKIFFAEFNLVSPSEEVERTTDLIGAQGCLMAVPFLHIFQVSGLYDHMAP